ncbi:unnamed protein product [Nippostrongylus brasiliensis]|uniref:Uncharacterized protein n=1 Tax=Nippostrongylus brasiliensis TaxID=27835 RepID=A0A0N4YI76_NIPBR|nr:unnamed protein product [Nippostrongylus brasiliensis]
MSYNAADLVAGVALDFIETGADEEEKDVGNDRGDSAVVGELESGVIVDDSVEWIVLIGLSWLLDFETEVGCKKLVTVLVTAWGCAMVGLREPILEVEVTAMEVSCFSDVPVVAGEVIVSVLVFLSSVLSPPLPNDEAIIMELWLLPCGGDAVCF